VLTGHDYWGHAAFMVIGAAFVIWAHRDNIDRLVHGTERKLGEPAHT
jgi:glycerol-3-phosphate acyltransferase PlsY